MYKLCRHLHCVLENVFWQTVLAKSGVFCHRRDNHSHIYKNIGVAKRSDNEEQGDKRIVVPVQEVGDGEREEPMEIRKFPREQDD